MSTPDRRALLDRDHGALSLRRQCMLLSVARSGVYRTPRPDNDGPRAGGDVALMRRIDELFTAFRSSARGGWLRCWGRRSSRSTASGCSG